MMGGQETDGPGWPAFGFTAAEFGELLSWPLYWGGSTEAPLDAVVSIGYTLATYQGNSGPVLSSNLQFIILLSTCKY